MQSLCIQCCTPLGLTLMVLCSYWMVLAGGQTCSLSAADLSLRTVTVSAVREDGPTPGARVTWSTTVPPECVASVTVEFRTSSSGSVVRSYTTTNTSETEVIQTGPQCDTTYYIRVEVTGVASLGTLNSNQIPVVVEDIPAPAPVIVRAEVTADNTSIRVLWVWSRQGLLMCLDSVRVDYQPEGGSLMMYTVDSATATSATLSNLLCNTQYTITIYAVGGRTGRRSTTRAVSLPARAPPTPTEVTVQVMNASSVRVAWQWTSSGPAPSCFNTTRVTYHPEGGGESSLQLRDPAATETILTGLQCNTRYTITVVATAGEHRRESVAIAVFLPLRGPQTLSAAVLSPTPVYLTWVAPCDTQQYHIHYKGTCGTYVDEGSLNTSQNQYTLVGLQEGIDYTFTVNQTGFGGGRVFSTGPVYARTFTAVPIGAPRLLEVTFVRNSQVDLIWKEVLCVRQNGPITGYVVRYYVTCGPDRDVQQTKSVVTTGSIIDGLTPNTEYAFQVAAVNTNGTGPFSEAITLGGAPRLVVVSLVNPITVIISWSEVQCFDGSGAVTHYLVQYQCDGTVQDVTMDGIVQTVSGLTPNAAMYTFRVAAVGINEMIGPFSDPVNASALGEIRMPLDLEEEVSAATVTGDTLLGAWTVAGVAIAAVLVLLAVVLVESTVIWYQQRATPKTTEIPMKECSAYGKIEGGDGREENYIYELPRVQ